MTNEEFLKDVCPNHTEQSKWNRNELLHILELHEKQLRICGVVSSKITVLVTYVKYVSIRHTEMKTTKTEVVEVKKLTELNELYENLKDVKILK